MGGKNYHTVGKMPKSNITVGTMPKSNIKTVEKCKLIPVGHIYMID